VDSIVYGNLRIELLTEHGGRIQRATARTRPPSVRIRPHPIPARPSGALDGRDEAVAAAHGAAAGRPVGFHAGCGYGKTTLLRQLAARSDGGEARYLRVAGQHLDDLLQQLVDELYLADGPFKPTPGQRIQLLAQARTLVLLDDVTLGPGELRELLDALPGCGVVLSSDRPLLGRLGSSIPLPGLVDAAALDLLRRDLGRELTSEERADAVRLSGIVDGQPLHLRQAAALVRSGRHSFAGLARLAEGDITVLDRLSLDELAEQERRVLAVLALAAGALLSSELLGFLADLATVDQALASLRRRGLVEQDGDRFGLPVCRAGDYRALLLRHLDLGAAGRRLGTWFTQQSWTGDEALSAAGAALTLIRYAAERGHWTMVIRLVDAVEPVLALAGRWEAWREVLEWGLEAAGSVADAGAEAQFSHQLGTLEFALDDLERARILWERALRLREELGDQAGAAVTRANLALLTPTRTGGRRPRRRRPSGRTIVAAALAGLGIFAFLLPLALGREPPTTVTSGGASTTGPATTTHPATTTRPATTTTGPATTTSTGGTTTTASAGRPVAAVDPTALRFRADAVGRATAAQQLRVRNTGTAPLPIGGIQVVGAVSGDFLVDRDTCLAGPVSPGGSCLIRVVFQPSATGTRTAVLVVDHGAPDSPATVSLTGVTPVPPLPPDLTPGAVDRAEQILVVTVRNVGRGDAETSTTQVAFGPNAVQSVETPAIPAGGSTTVEVPIPSGCFNPDCDYTIDVDATQQLQESDETNNQRSGGFIG
jgi:CARDB